MVSTPLLDIEVRPWIKPPAAVCFSLHPLGAMALYSRARLLLLLDTGLVSSLSAEQLTETERALWRFAAKLFLPGASIRSRLDLAVEDRYFKIREEDDRDPSIAQPSRLAAWLVLRAALDMAQGADA